MLTDKQLKEEYFNMIGGFSQLNIIHELNEYNGESQICIACTQLKGEEEKTLFPDVKSYSQSDKKRILKEWIDFLCTETKAIKKLHFNSKVPQSLFNAACCQEELEELRFKWGTYSDLSPIENLKNLKFLYIGPGSSVSDITSLGKMKNLIVLHMEGFKKIEDYSSLKSLEALEQLVIWGPVLGFTPIKDLEFLREMPNLRSISIGNVRLKRKYTKEEIRKLYSDLPNLHFINNCIFS